MDDSEWNGVELAWGVMWSGEAGDDGECISCKGRFEGVTKVDEEQSGGRDTS